MNEMIVSVEQTNGILNISNYDEIKANVQASMELYKTMVFTEDTLIEAKSTVATLRKLSKCLDDKRKDVKRRYMLPYEEFEDKIKELQQIIAEPIELIAQQTIDNDGWNNIVGFEDHFFIDKHNPRIEVVLEEVKP